MCVEDIRTREGVKGSKESERKLEKTKKVALGFSKLSTSNFSKHFIELEDKTIVEEDNNVSNVLSHFYCPNVFLHV